MTTPENSVQEDDVELTAEEILSNDQDRIRRLIEHVFRQYPQISPSMLQISLAISAKDWQPQLDQLIKEGKVHRWTNIRETPTSGRKQTYVTLLWASSGVIYGAQPAPLGGVSRVSS